MSALGAPIRRDSPPARITAASGLGFRTAPAGIGELIVMQASSLREFHGFMRQVPRVAAHGNELGADADGDFLRRESADIQADRRMHALEFGRGVSFAFECAIDRNDLSLAADHTDV